ncbi:MAG: hypothetical protein R2812_01910 [Gelidibacter sp.]|nr:hypothetical protein [Gelidibacter sp.]
MKSLIFLFVGFFILSCNTATNHSNDTNSAFEKEDSNLSGKKVLENIELQKLIKSTQKNINDLETKSGLSFKKNLIVGKLVDNTFQINDGISYNILKLNVELESLKLGYNVDYATTEFVSKADNNGFAMIVFKGKSKTSGTTVSMAIDLNENKNTNTYSVNPNPISHLVCEGCSDGCSPRRHENGDGYCTPCNPYSDTCKKTESL